jgi:dienelactone hydrolase
VCAAESFSYDAKRPVDIRDSAKEVAVRDISFAGAEGGRTKAFLVRPLGTGGFAGVLFVHWLESGAPDSNRTQFLSQAVELAQAGTVSLLVETMWSDPDWFTRRNQADDYTNSVRQVKELRRALDVLLAEPGVDPKRVAYVGHDFGAMYGALLAGVDKRPRFYALQAGTSEFSHWFLLFPKLEGEARQAFIERLAPLDPTRYIGEAGVPVLLQFGKKDPFVPEAKANAFITAAKEPKTVLWYDAGHPLNEQAVKDRQSWLKAQLGLK